MPACLRTSAYTASLQWEYLAGSVHAVAWQETCIAGQGSQHHHLRHTSILIRHSMCHTSSAMGDQLPPVCTLQEDPSEPVEHGASASCHLEEMARNGTSTFPALLQTGRHLSADKCPVPLMCYTGQKPAPLKGPRASGKPVEHNTTTKSHVKSSKLILHVRDNISCCWPLHTISLYTQWGYAPVFVCVYAVSVLLGPCMSTCCGPSQCCEHA